MLTNDVKIEDPAPALCGRTGELREPLGDGSVVSSLCPGCPQCAGDPELDLGDLAVEVR